MKNKISKFFIILGIMYIVSAIMLTILSMLVWKLDSGSGFLCGGVIAVYIVSNILGGFLLGKIMGKQKFFWGIMIGVAYFVILLIAGLCIVKTSLVGNTQLISGIMICVISGMLGGMLAPTKA